MAIYHLSAKEFSRGKGHSVVAAAAYRARCELTDERTGLKHDYSRKSGELLFSGIYAPKDAPEWAHDRAQLWNHVEAFEKHRGALLAREFEAALPAELTLEQNRYLLQDWVRENFTRHGLIADVNIHAPSKDGDERNVHAHVMVVMRKLDGSEFVRTKERFGTYTEKDEARKAELVNLRQSWARIGNRHLERYGHAPTLDWRSLLEQGSERAPTIHKGKEATAIERKGGVSELGNVNREIEAANARVIDLAAERERRQEGAQTRDRDEGKDTPEKSPTASHGPENGPSAEQQRAAERAAWIAERKAEREQRRPASWIEQRIAESAPQAQLYSAPITVDREGQRVTGADVLADRLKPEGEREFRSAMARSYAEAFSARLDDAGIALVRVTASDVKTLAELREASQREEPTRRTATGSLRHTIFADVQAGDLAAVTKSGDVYRINPEKLGRAVLPENLPSVIEARTAFETDRHRTEALYQQRNTEQLAKREEIAEVREKRAAQINQWKDRSAEKGASKGFGFGGKVIGAIAVGALKFLDGLFSSPKKRTVEEIKNDIRALHERREIAAERAAIRENETRRGEEIERKDEEQSQHLTAPAYFRTVTRPINRGRDRDDDGYERERERER